MNRINFSSNTKKIVSERAGLQCSYPSCNRRTQGPGAESDEVSNSGTAAHIYSASEGGPRGHGGLNEEELKHPDNAIWLCRNHGTLIDNNRGDDFPPELLLSYKQLHEARISREHKGLYSPVAWFHVFKIKRSPIFKSNSSITLTKLNLIIGNNSTGKSAICEWLAGLFDLQYLIRWRSPTSHLSCQLKFFLPQDVGIGMGLKDEDNITYYVDGIRAPLNPYRVNFIYPMSEPRRRSSAANDDDLIHLAKILKVDTSVIPGLVEEIHTFEYATIWNIRFVTEDTSRTLYLDGDGLISGLSFSALSGREQERVFIEFSTALARYCGRYSPTFLILDGFVFIFFEGWFDYFSHHLLDPDNQFQTILTIPTQDIKLDQIRWNGWQVIKTLGTLPDCEIEQSKISL